MDDIIKIFMSNFVMLFALIGIFAFLVSMITEVTKGLGFLAKIPTDLQVIVLSILICQVAYFAYSSYFSIEIQWYYVAGCLIIAFMVAFVAMYGWDKLTNLYNRLKEPGGKL